MSLFRTQVLPLNQEKLFRNSLILSASIHLLLWGGFYIRNVLSARFLKPSSLEIDLTKPLRIGGNPLLKPGGGTTLKPPKIEGKPAVSSVLSETKSTPKEWVLPGPQTKEIEKPVPVSGPVADQKGVESEGTGEGFYGSGGGWGGGEGQGGGIPLDRFPKLLNRKEILRLLKRHYPSAERESGTESVVVVDLHLSEEGNVVSIEIIESGGLSFDEVAQLVGKKMRFSPAMMENHPVSVKIRQSIVFRLEE